jgi:hypothetical protein
MNSSAASPAIRTAVATTEKVDVPWGEAIGTERKTKYSDAPMKGTAKTAQSSHDPADGRAPRRTAMPANAKSAAAKSRATVS